MVSIQLERNIMIIRSIEVRLYQVIIIPLILFLYWYIGSFYIDSTNYSTLHGIIFIFVLFLLEFICTYLNYRYFGEVLAIVATDFIQIKSKKYKWESIVK